MNNHYDLSDYEFEQKFVTCTLPTALFNHEAHLRLAWLQINKNGLAVAIQNISDQLLAYVRSVGAQDKYNAALTIAAIRLVADFMKRSTSNSFVNFITEFPELKTNFATLIRAYQEL